MIGTRTLFSLFLFCLAHSVYSQSDSLAPELRSIDAEVKATVRLDGNKVPENRTTTLVVAVSWQGDLDRFDIEKVNAPGMSNLEVVGNSSSNRVGQQDSRKVAEKKYEFLLRPLALGMAYVEGTIVEYRDNVTGKTHRLVTDRLELEVTDAIVEGGSARVGFAIGALFVALSLTVGAGVALKKRKERRTRQLLAEEDNRPIEGIYLADLKTGVDLQGTDLANVFSQLSRLYRKYLAEKYGIHAMGMTSKEIALELEANGVQQATIEATAEALDLCDFAKFTGQTEPGKMQRAYALVEEVLQSNSKVSRSATNEKLK